MADSESSSHTDWLRDFWDRILGSRRGRRWEVATLIDGNIFLRDGFAYSLVFHRLYGREDVGYRYVRAYMVDAGQPSLNDEDDLVFIGRPKPFMGTVLGSFVQELEGPAVGRFCDLENGERALAIQYGWQRYERRVCDEPPFGRYRRSDRDYGIFMMRQQQNGAGYRTILSIGGIGSLGTLGLMVLLDDDECRRDLVTMVNDVVGWKDAHCPERHFEMCVRIEVPGRDRLDRLLHHASRRDPDLFEYGVEAVVVGSKEGKPELFFCQQVRADLYLKRGRDGSEAGEVRVGENGAWRPMAPQRFAVLLAIAEDPQRASPADLCRRLGFSSGRESRLKNNLSKVVHDLNGDLTSQEFLGSRVTRPVRFNKREGRYFLHQISATVTQRADQRGRWGRETAA